MAGCRALTESELSAALDAARLFPTRDRALLVLGVNTGFRIHELVSLKVGEVWTGTEPKATVSIPRQRLKGGRGPRRRAVSARVVPLNRSASLGLEEYLTAGGDHAPDSPLFPSRKGTGPITPGHANRILQRIFAAASLKGPLGSHTARKTFCARVYATSGYDIVLTKVAMGHALLATTERYLAASDEQAASVIRNLDVAPTANFGAKEQSA